MEQITHTAGLLSVREDGEANTYALIDDTDRWLLALLHNGVQATERQRANVRRLAAAWNACDGLTTGEIEAIGAFNAAGRVDAMRSVRTELDAIRAAVRAHDDRMDDKANDGANAQPPNGDDYNELFGIVMNGAPDPWHLFYIEASDADGTHAYLMSAQSGSQEKARELAEAVVLDEMIGSAEEPGSIEHCGFIGIVDGDVCETIGLLADD